MINSSGIPILNIKPPMKFYIIIFLFIAMGDRPFDLCEIWRGHLNVLVVSSSSPYNNF
jgi:hypothetical protein